MGKATLSSFSFAVLFGISQVFFFQIADAKPLACDVSAPSAILMNADTGVVLYEKNARNPTYPASTTKIATALYALHLARNRLDHPVTIYQEAVAAVSPSLRRSSGRHPSHRLEFGGSHMSLKVGEILSLESLLYGLMVCSGNDAANAIAHYAAGSIPEFMNGLNSYLKSIGCQSTHFTNPHGLPDPLHRTSAFDLALMTSYALKDSVFKQVVKTTRYLRPKTNKQEESYLIQSNALLKPGKHFYPYAIGVKTGYTAAAGSNLVAAAEKDGRRLIAVALNCEDMSQRYRSCISMFEAAFSEQKVERKLFSKDHDSFTCTIEGAKTPLVAVLSKDLIVEYFPSEESKLDAKLSWQKLELPIAENQVVGKITIRDARGTVVALEPIFSKTSVDMTAKYKAGLYVDRLTKEVSKYKVWIGLLAGAVMISMGYVHRRRSLKSKN